MTCSEFIRNNRGINGGDNLPQDFLTSLYDNISRNEIKISTEAAANTADVSPILWSDLNSQSKSPRGQMLEVTSHGKTTRPIVESAVDILFFVVIILVFILLLLFIIVICYCYGERYTWPLLEV